MSSKTKQKSSKKQKPKSASANTSLQFDPSTMNSPYGRKQQPTFAMASRNHPELDGVYPPLCNFATPAMSTPYLQPSRPHTASSRLPFYTGNGTPRGYNRPYEGYNSVQQYAQFSSDCHLLPQPHHTYSQHNYEQPYVTRRGTPSPNLVPYDAKLQQALHRCQMAGASHYGHRSAPVSARTTPSNSIPGTPHDVNRRKDLSFYKSSCSTPSKLSRTPSLQNSSAASVSSKSRKFESYLPLCQVQRAMKKGEVIEGVLRINPRNYEDAYISAPDGEMDIYIGGIVDRNRSMNGDKVAVLINPMSEWRILFDTIRLHWNDWSDDLLKCVNEPNTSRNILNTSVNLHTNNANLASIPENLSLTNAANGTSPITECSEQANNIAITGTNPSTSQSQSLNLHCAKKLDLDSKLLPQSFNPANVASHDNVLCDASSEKIVSNDIQSKSSKKKRKRQRKKKLKADQTAETSNLLVESNDSDAPHSLDEFDDSVNFSELKEITKPSIQGSHIVFDMCEIPMKHNLIDVNETLLPTKQNNDELCQSAPLEEIADDQWVDMSSSEAELNDVKNSSMCPTRESLSTRKDELFTTSIDDKVRESEEDCSKNVVVEDNQSLKDMIRKLNAMTVISSNANNKSSKKKKTAIDQPKRVTIVIDKKNELKSQSRPKLKNTFGLPDAILSINVLDLLKLPFGSQCVQKTGKVVYIVEKNHPRIAGGKLKLPADRYPNFALFSPNDSKVPRMLIDRSQCPKDFFDHPEHYSQTLFLAQIEDWVENATFPKGKLLKTLGDVGDIEAETEMILMENGIDDSEYDEDTCKEFLALLDKNGEFKIPSAERNNRRSFTSECVFTIDPSTARDLDDALSVKVLDEKAHNGRQLYEVGVHIADVTYFLRPGGPCDMTARHRTTSVYLVQKVIPMLPRILCEKLCSLNPGEEKLTFSVVWKMDIEGHAYEEWFGRTTIESCVKLSYELAQDMIDNPDREWAEGSLPTIYGNWTTADISSRVNILMTMARGLRQRRFEDGALSMSTMKFSFVLNPESGLPVGFTPENRRESNFLVEEFMLAANMAVAHRTYREYPNLAFLRCHPPPDSKPLREFQEFCENASLTIDNSSEEAFKLCVSKLVSDDSLNSKVISYYFLRSITMAMYFCAGMSSSEEAFKHYALNVPLYTHFTSPIRRYADVIVHRLLSATLKYTSDIPDDAMDLHRLAKRCNDMKMAAANASEQSSKLFINLYLKTVGPVTEKGVVSQVLDHAFDVIIPKFGHMARIYIESLDVKSFQYRSQGKRQYLELVWNKVEEVNAHQVISAFSAVTLRISVYENDLTKWNVTLLPNK